jgi:DNA-binding NtrC family response regulator
MAEREFDILLVEDEQDHAELIQRAFESSELSYRLRVVGTLEEARSVLALSLPRLVITDLLLPDGCGVELIPPDSETSVFPVVVLTSHGDENVAVEAIKTGALDYVVKSRETLADMPHIAERDVREWEHICDRMQARKALRENEQRFRSVVETAGNVIVILNSDGLITEWNPAAEQLYGWSREEVHSKNYLDMFLLKEI